MLHVSRRDVKRYCQYRYGRKNLIASSSYYHPSDEPSSSSLHSSPKKRHNNKNKKKKKKLKLPELKKSPKEDGSLFPNESPLFLDKLKEDRYTTYYKDSFVTLSMSSPFSSSTLFSRSAKVHQPCSLVNPLKEVTYHKRSKSSSKRCNPKKVKHLAKKVSHQLLLHSLKPNQELPPPPPLEDSPPVSVSNIYSNPSSPSAASHSRSTEAAVEPSFFVTNYPLVHLPS
mmetsp:Transcript_12829/g.19326  ORF Transcript_12829/g.19326 Transcript_12829/m.19326 type:complete len:227 (-) Transcript_12829:33-713(-)